MTTRAYAKINLDLRLGCRRPDGFHPIDTFFVRVNLFDTLAAKLTQDSQCTLTIEGDADLSPGPDNLILRAARALQRHAAKGAGVQLHLSKVIPQGAGLGGGSSDAATTLLILRQLWAISLTEAELSHLAAELGSDVPFFLQPYAAQGTGRGETLQPIPLQNLPWAVLVHPGFPSPTADAYQAYARNPTPGTEGPALALVRQNGEQLILHPRNDLEVPVENKFFWIRSARQWLQKQPGVLAARMSGSGSTVFGLWSNEEEAIQTVAHAQKHFGPETWIRSARLLSGVT